MSTREMLVDEMQDEITRLKSLIKKVEKTDGVVSAGHCPWCGWFVGAPLTFHGPDCEAFTPQGEVK